MNAPVTMAPSRPITIKNLEFISKSEKPRIKTHCVMIL